MNKVLACIVVGNAAASCTMSTPSVRAHERCDPQRAITQRQCQSACPACERVAMYTSMCCKGNDCKHVHECMNFKTRNACMAILTVQKLRARA